MRQRLKTDAQLTQRAEDIVGNRVLVCRGKLFTQCVGSFQITSSGFIVRCRHIVEINMLDIFDPRIPQSPVIHDARHGHFPIGLVVRFFEERRADDQGLFMVKQRHSTFRFAAPAVKKPIASVSKTSF